MGPGLIPNRECEPEGAPLSRFALKPDLPMVRFHGKPAKGESEPGGMPMFAATICLSKFFKDVFMLVARYPFAVVTHRDGRSGRVGLNPHPDRPG
jgi:hypothetical protein